MGYLSELEFKLTEKGYSDKYKERCLRYAGNLSDKGLPVIFDIKHLSKLMGVRYPILYHYIVNADNFYKDFVIPKKTGGIRKICAPSMNLKKIQRWILDNILMKFDIDESAKGFIKNNSIVDNAKIHTNKALVYNIDIKNFFPSISSEKVYFLFYNKGYSSEVSFAFSKLVSYKGYLPQGSPCSPILSNIICVKMDRDMRMLAYKINANYSRYADDMTISTNDIRLFVEKKEAFKKIVKYNGFNLNDKKERMQFGNQPQFVTGLIVNDGVKIRRQFKKDVEQQIYYCEKYGIFNHLKQLGLENKSFYKEYLYGKVNFMKSVEVDVGNSFLERLDKLDWSY